MSTILGTNNIQISRFYKLRDGTMAKIYSVKAGGPKPIHGAWYCKKTDSWVVCTWQDNGYHLDEGEGGCAKDIMEEWSDPTPRLLAWVKNGGLTLAQFLPEDQTPKSQRWDCPESWRRAPWLDEPEEE